MFNVLHVSAECSPYVKIGGLADVVGSLPSEIKRLRGAEVRVFLPYYKAIPKQYRRKVVDVLDFRMDFAGERDVYVGVKKFKKGNILYYFIDNEFYFGSRDNVYGYGDESTRFAYFQLAVLESLPYLDFYPDIIPVHDCHTAMLPLLINNNNYDNIKATTV